MSDLVERLRRGADDASLDCYAMCEEAAARIEALEAALRGLLKANEQTDDAREIARAALAPEREK